MILCRVTLALCYDCIHSKNGCSRPLVNAALNLQLFAAEFNSIWQRRMKNYVKAVNKRFNEQDIRAKTTSDTNPNHAHELMQHSSKEFTERTYRRG